MTKILWHSNAPWAPTGYGAQTALMTPKLAEHHEVYISVNYGLDAAPIVWKGIPVLPGLGSDHGNATIPGHVASVFGGPRDGLLVTLYDTPVFDPDLFSKMNVACWTPVDHNPLPPRVVGFFRHSQAIPIAMSHYGEEQLAEFDPLYVPHGVDTAIYKPTTSDVREQMNVPEDAFLVGMVAANKGRPSRKCFQQAFEAFRHLLQKHDDVFLYLHTTLAPEYAQGEDLLALLGSLEIPEDRVRFPNQYSMIQAPVPGKRMADIYSSFDVLLNASMGEGFGVPILEAQACGTPAIVTDFSAMPEVCGAGWKVKGRPFWTGQASWMAIPDVAEIVEALDECHELTGPKRHYLAKKAREHAETYDADKVFTEHMLPAIAEIEERIGNLAPLKVAA